MVSARERKRRRKRRKELRIRLYGPKGRLAKGHTQRRRIRRIERRLSRR